MSGGAASDRVALRFFLPPEDLRPFITTIYMLEVSGCGGGWIEDRLHPEWANLRLIPDMSIEAAIGDAPMAGVSAAVMTGPTSVSTHFRARDGVSWGIGLLPMGWARFVDAPADAYADRPADVMQDPAMARLAPLLGSLDAGSRTPAARRDRLVDHLRRALAPPTPREPEILRLELALVDTSIHTVSGLAEKAELSVRTLERLSASVFGFPPQLLLRRQRFLRSLAQFMLDPSLKWIETLDGHYHDQAHFVRDFKRFMGMSPSEYARLPHPVLGAAAHARMAVAGEALQVLHRPDAP